MRGHDDLDIPFTEDKDDRYWDSVSDKPNYSRTYGHKRHGKEIVFQIKPRTIRIDKQFFERSIYFLIILVLAIALLWKPLTGMSFGANSAKDATGAVVLGGPVEEVVPPPEETVVENNTNEVVQLGSEPEPEPEPVVEPEPEPEPEPVLSGKMFVTIESVDAMKYPTGNGGKIMGVWVQIKNEKEDFTPQVELYVYDSDSTSIYKTKPRSTEILATLLAGKNTRINMDDFTAQFPDASSKKTVKVFLKDANSGDILKEMTKLIEI